MVRVRRPGSVSPPRGRSRRAAARGRRAGAARPLPSLWRRLKQTAAAAPARLRARRREGSE